MSLLSKIRFSSLLTRNLSKTNIINSQRFFSSSLRRLQPNNILKNNNNYLLNIGKNNSNTKYFNHLYKDKITDIIGGCMIFWVNGGILFTIGNITDDDFFMKTGCIISLIPFSPIIAILSPILYFYPTSNIRTIKN